MNELQVFDNKEFGEIRTATIDNEPWFVGKDVAAALGCGNGNNKSKALTNALADHVDEEDKKLVGYEELKGYQNGDLKNFSHYGAIFINESGLYALIFGSKLESAKRFKRWVTSEVLPAIRKTGSYGERKHLPTRPLTSDDYMEAAQTVRGCPLDRLDIVLGFYEIAGLEIPKVQEKVEVQKKAKEKNEARATDAQWTQVREILGNYSLREAAAKTNIPFGTLGCYRNGKRKPTEERCNIIINMLG